MMDNAFTSLYFFLLLFSLILINFQLFSQNKFSEHKQLIHIDSIEIKNNWRTKEKIILSELKFEAGDTVSYNMIDTSISKIWNTGNFATVTYDIRSLNNGENILLLKARDGLTVYPYIALDASGKEYNIGLGAEDENFLGRNIDLRIIAGINSKGNDWDFKLGIPRQLLYKNMTFDFHYKFGRRKYARIINRKKQFIVPYNFKSIYGTFGNPWNKDYSYTFSPDLNWKLFRHEINYALLDSSERGIQSPDKYIFKGLQLSLDEGIGIIDTKRHRKNGFSVNFQPGVGIGLTQQNPGYLFFNFNAEYHRTLNNIIQFSAVFNSEYTTSDVASLQYYKGASEIRGYQTGEIFGKCFYSAYVGLHFTYFNYEWFSLEHSVFFNLGNGADQYPDLFLTKQLASVGTAFRFMIPMFPALSLQLSLSYSGPGSNWFNVRF